MINHLDLWDVGQKVNINKYPKKFHKAVKMRLEQQKYKFNKTDTSLNLFRTLLNQPANIITPSSFCDYISKIFKPIKNTNVIIKDTKQLKKEGLNLIVSVDHLTGHMLIVEYNGNNAVTYFGVIVGWYPFK